jgi:glycosyltransferase involved in cell wall biosynthesis
MIKKGKHLLSSTLVLMPALNEEEGIARTIVELRRHLGNVRLLVVDGNSRDRTMHVANSLGADVLCQEGTGKGNAVGYAVRHVGSDVVYVVLIDADFTYPARFIPKMIKILQENPDVGMVCGNRFNPHLRWGTMRNLFYIGNRFLAFAHNLMNGINLSDPLTGLRVIRWEILKGWTPKSSSFDIEVELNHLVERKGYGIVEIPICYRQRIGEKKLRARHGVTILKRILLESI